MYLLYEQRLVDIGFRTNKGWVSEIYNWEKEKIHQPRISHYKYLSILLKQKENKYIFFHYVLRGYIYVLYSHKKILNWYVTYLKWGNTNFLCHSDLCTEQLISQHSDRHCPGILVFDQKSNLFFKKKIWWKCPFQK